MSRPTIRDLAEAAGVSVATVNRVLSGAGKVKPLTMQHVKDVAQEIGFYGSGAIESRVSAARPRYRFGFVLHQSSRLFYQNVAKAIREAAELMENARVEVHIEFIENLSPQNIASKMMSLAETTDAIGVVSAVHPVVTQAVEMLEAQGKPVFALISQLATTGRVPYVGCDNWKMGRTAAWIMDHVCKQEGKLGILMGNPRYQCQEVNESGFRSYFRENERGFSILEPLLTFESSAVSQEMTEKLLRENPDLRGLYVAGGGISGVIAAIRSAGMSGKLAVVGYELMDSTREALLDGTMTFVLSIPLQKLAKETIAGMIRAVGKQADAGNYTSVLAFELFTRENV